MEVGFTVGDFQHETLRRLLDWAELMLRTGDPERAAGPAIYAKVSPEDATLIRGIIRHHIAPAE